MGTGRTQGGRKAPVALSDEERRRLEKLERELAATCPDLDRELQSGAPRRAAARTVYGVLAAVAGFVLVIMGTIAELIIVGVVGFLLMVAGGHWFLSGRPQDRLR